LTFPNPHKIDLEKFMLSNFISMFNEKFAQLTGRSLAGFKRFSKNIRHITPTVVTGQTPDTSPLPDRKKNKKPSAIYLELDLKACPIFPIHLSRSLG